VEIELGVEMELMGGDGAGGGNRAEG